MRTVCIVVAMEQEAHHTTYLDLLPHVPSYPCISYITPGPWGQAQPFIQRHGMVKEDPSPFVQVLSLFSNRLLSPRASTKGAPMVAYSTDIATADGSGPPLRVYLVWNGRDRRPLRVRDRVRVKTEAHDHIWHAVRSL